MSSERRLPALTRLRRWIVLDALRAITIAGNVLMHAIHFLEARRNARRARRDSPGT